MPFLVQRRQCSTCIYRSGLGWDLKKLEAQIADPRMAGFFTRHRVCHNSDVACCRGFWSRHRDDFTLGQMAQRLGLVEFVEHQKQD